MTRSTCGAHSRAPSSTQTSRHRSAHVWAAYLFSATLALSLAACGGGGSDNAATPAAPASSPLSTGQGALRVEVSTAIAPDDLLRFTATCTGATNYSWDWGDGSTASNTPANTATHAYSTVGSFTANVVCNGPRGPVGNGSAQLQIKMPAATVQVTSSALVAPQQSVNVTATCASATSYRWSWQDGTGTETVPIPSATHLYGTAGDYAPKVECLNARGTVIATGSASVRVALPKHGISAVTAYTVRGAAQTETHFSATCTGSHTGAVLSYDWDFGDGTPHSAAVNPVHNYANEPARNIIAKLQCTEDQAIAVKSDVAVIIDPSTAAPRIESALGGDTVGLAGHLFTFGTTCKATNGGVITYSYDFGDGARGDSLGSASHIYASPGTYRAQATCTQSGGGSQIQSINGVTVTIDPATAQPRIESALVVDRTTGFKGSTLTFKTSCVATNSGAITYSYDFGDGSSSYSTLGTASHVYASLGTYRAHVTCIQSGSGSQLQSINGITITVDPATAAPRVESALSVDGVFLSDLPLTFSTTCAATNGGTISYSYDFGDGSSSYSTLGTASHAFAAFQTYRVQVTCTQSGGDGGSKTQYRDFYIDLNPPFIGGA